MKPCELTKFEMTMLWGAIRYFCQRKTIAGAMFPAEAIENIYCRMSERQRADTVKVLKQELEFTDGVFGDKNIDDVHWQRFLAALDKDRHFEVELKDGSKHVCFNAKGVVYPLEEYLKHPHREIVVPYENIKK